MVEVDVAPRVAAGRAVAVSEFDVGGGRREGEVLGGTRFGDLEMREKLWNWVLNLTIKITQTEKSSMLNLMIQLPYY